MDFEYLEFNSNGVNDSKEEMRNIFAGLKNSCLELESLYNTDYRDTGFCYMRTDVAAKIDGQYESYFSDGPSGQVTPFSGLYASISKLDQGLFAVLENLFKYVDMKVDNYSNIDVITSSELSEVQKILDSVDIL